MTATETGRIPPVPLRVGHGPTSTRAACEEPGASGHAGGATAVTPGWVSAADLEQRRVAAERAERVAAELVAAADASRRRAAELRQQLEARRQRTGRALGSGVEGRAGQGWRRVVEPERSAVTTALVRGPRRVDARRVNGSGERAADERVPGAQSRREQQRHRAEQASELLRRDVRHLQERLGRGAERVAGTEGGVAATMLALAARALREGGLSDAQGLLSEAWRRSEPSGTRDCAPIAADRHPHCRAPHMLSRAARRTRRMTWWTNGSRTGHAALGRRPRGSGTTQLRCARRPLAAAMP